MLYVRSNILSLIDVQNVCSAYLCCMYVCKYAVRDVEKKCSVLKWSVLGMGFTHNLREWNIIIF